MPDVILLKTPTCTINCNKVAARLDKLGIAYTFVVIDTDDDQHNAMLIAAREAGYSTSPVFCMQNTDESLRYIGAGPDEIAIQQLLKELRDLASVDA